MAKGVPARLWSLTMENDEVFVRRGGPGELIEIDQPEYVNVRLKNKKIVPLPRKHDTIRTPKGVKNIPIYWMPYYLPFAITFYTCQGMTLKRVILVLNKRSSRYLSSLVIAGVYVGLSRVTNSEHFKIWPCERHELNHLEDMQYHNDLWLWLRNYDDNGDWIKNGLAKVLSLEGKRALKEVVKKDTATMDHEDIIRYARIFNIAFSGLSKEALASKLEEKIHWLSRWVYDVWETDCKSTANIDVRNWQSDYIITTLLFPNNFTGWRTHSCIP